jgi:hypothetical protein
MSANFMEILNKPFDDIKPPKPLPVGTYLCLVDGQPDYRRLGKDQNGAAIFKFKPIQADADVDQADLLEALEGKALSEVSFQTTFWITEKALYRLKDFLNNALGIEGNGRQLPEVIPEAAGKQVKVTIGHRPGDDGKAMYADVKGFARV